MPKIQPKSFRKIKGYKRLHNYAGHCDTHTCHMQARWQVTFEDSGSLFLCPRHKDNLVESHRRLEGT